MTDKPEEKDKKADHDKSAPKEETPSSNPLPDTEKAGDDDDDSFDFGGLPNRSLKKNLGCA